MNATETRAEPIEPALKAVRTGASASFGHEMDFATKWVLCCNPFHMNLLQYSKAIRLNILLISIHYNGIFSYRSQNKCIYYE